MQITEKNWKKAIIFILLILSALGAFKSLILGLEIDEGYAVASAYRLAGGDLFIKEMWEPHQFSALIPALFIKLFVKITGGNDYLIMGLRGLGILIQLGVSVFWYRTMKLQFGKMISLCTALIIFNTLPKWIMGPEFTNMFLWFFLLTFLCLFRYHKEGKMVYCGLAAICMVVSVLSYPSGVLVFPLYLILLRKKNRQGDRDKKGFWLFGGICLGAAVILLCYLLSYMSFGELIDYIKHILNDNSHSIGIGEKAVGYLIEIGEILLYLIPHCLIGVAGVRIYKRKGGRKIGAQYLFGTIVLLTTSVAQIVYWSERRVPALHPQIRYLVLFALGAVIWFSAEKESREKWKDIFFLAWVPSIGTLLSVLLLTNLDIKVSLVHLLPGMMCTLLMWDDSEPKEEGAGQKKTNRYFCLLVLFWVATLLFERGYFVKNNSGIYYDVFYAKQKALSGPAKGIYCEWMVGTLYNQADEFLGQWLEPGDKVLYIGEEALIYLHEDVEICTASTISTPFFGKDAIEYYEKNPQKYPEKILISTKYWNYLMADQQEMKEWVAENFDLENKIESENLWIVEKK